MNSPLRKVIYHDSRENHRSNDNHHFDLRYRRYVGFRSRSGWGICANRGPSYSPRSRCNRHSRRSSRARCVPPLGRRCRHSRTKGPRCTPWCSCSLLCHPLCRRSRTPVGSWLGRCGYRAASRSGEDSRSHPLHHWFHRYFKFLHMKNSSIPILVSIQIHPCTRNDPLHPLCQCYASLNHKQGSNCWNEFSKYNQYHSYNHHFDLRYRRYVGFRSRSGWGICANRGPSYSPRSRCNRHSRRSSRARCVPPLGRRCRHSRTKGPRCTPWCSCSLLCHPLCRRSRTPVGSWLGRCGYRAASRSGEDSRSHPLHHWFHRYFKRIGKVGCRSSQ